ncbi:MAG: hypothetical protein KDE26_13610 [Bacteroidetes bacterium]|nr:hypothetical protein [Bacteroidota bacterium]MCB0844285.1 hypothetical protein [Bacteroidota bacterium]
MLRSIILIVFTSILGSVWAQQSSKSERALYELMESGYLKTYKDYRYEIEKRAGLFKVKVAKSEGEAWVEMENSYLRTSEAFEHFILVTRNDFLDRKRRKFIRKNTEDYVKERLEELNNIYTEYFVGKYQPLYTSLILDEESLLAEGNERTSLPTEIPLALIAPAARATLEVIEFLDEKNDKDIDELKALLEEEWVKPNQFRPWKDL